VKGLVISQVAYGSDAYTETIALRENVLRKPLGLLLTQELLDLDPPDFHIVCHQAGQLVGCLILSRKESHLIGMRQVAVSPAHQRQGIGRALCEYAENFARDRGFATMTLHARDSAVPFYEKLGYNRTGEPFEQVTVTHWVMNKTL
jgi:ribosomal protein S18 acetylase RimI-like enzyme